MYWAAGQIRKKGQAVQKYRRRYPPNELKPTLIVALAVAPHAFPATESAAVHCFPAGFLFLTYALSLN